MPALAIDVDGSIMYSNDNDEIQIDMSNSVIDIIVAIITYINDVKLLRKEISVIIKIFLPNCYVVHVVNYAFDRIIQVWKEFIASHSFHLPDGVDIKVLLPVPVCISTNKANAFWRGQIVT